jgi:hypothetical protein
MTRKEEKEALIEGKKYLIEGSEMVYVGSESTKHYFQKTDDDGRPIGRRRMIMGMEDKVAEVLYRRSKKQ